jgi:hypothetical protein
MCACISRIFVSFQAICRSLSASSRFLSASSRSLSASSPPTRSNSQQRGERRSASVTVDRSGCSASVTVDRPGCSASVSVSAAASRLFRFRGGAPPCFMGASPWHRWRWLPAGYCGKLLLDLATTASWLIQQNLTGSVSVYQEVYSRTAVQLYVSRMRCCWLLGCWPNAQRSDQTSQSQDAIVNREILEIPIPIRALAQAAKLLAPRNRHRRDGARGRPRPNLQQK